MVGGITLSCSSAASACHAQILHIHRRTHRSPIRAVSPSITAGRCIRFSARQTTTPEACWIGIWEGWGGLNGPAVAIFAADPESEEFKKRGVETERLNSALAYLAQRVDDAPRFEHPGRKYVLARTPCRSVCELIHPPVDVTPSLVWPEDRAWLVGSEIDFDSTLVAGSEECITALLSDYELEIVRVEPEGRLDIDGDVLNTL